MGIYNYVLYLTASFSTYVDRPDIDTKSDSYDSEKGPIPSNVEPSIINQIEPPIVVPEEIVSSNLYVNLNNVLTKPVVDYIVTTPEALEEMKEVMKIQGMSMSPSEEFFKKYGLKVSDKDYSSNYHKVEVIPVDTKALFLASLLKYKVVLVLLLFTGLGLYFLYYKKFKK